MGSKLRLHVLATGSSGNCSIVEDVESGRCVAIDCGICRREFMSRCQECGVDPSTIDAFFVTHAHSDHTSGLGVVLRGIKKLGAQPRVFAHDTTVLESSPIQKIADSFEVLHLEQGESYSVADMTVTPFPTSHDTLVSFGFKIQSQDAAVGFMTDTGIITDEARQALESCTILALEANHDEDMLANGPYPYWLKQRIASSRGHLSNSQCSMLLEELLWPGLKHVITMHASENNNTYPLALAAAVQTLENAGHNALAFVGYQDSPVTVG